MFYRRYIISFIAVSVILVLIFVGPISQNDNYHHFADKRYIANIPNSLNVITNIPFACVSFLGFLVAKNFPDRQLRHIVYILSLGFLLLTLGSGYYHLKPNNVTLVYDRIPMSIIFMSFFTFIISDRIDKKWGYLLFILLNVLGIGTVIYWIITEQRGIGDVRWYAMIQFFPIIAIPLILWLYDSPFKYIKEIISIFLFFGIAKFTEAFDYQIYDFFNQTISGHSIKHLFMAMAGYYIIRMLNKYRIQL